MTRLTVTEPNEVNQRANQVNSFTISNLNTLVDSKPGFVNTELNEKT